MTDETTTIAAVAKGRGTEVRVSLTVFKSTRLLDVRVFAAFTDDNELRATKRGIALPVERLGSLRAALDQAETVARERGWIE